jgi:hypothetical protein
MNAPDASSEQPGDGCKQPEPNPPRIGIELAGELIRGQHKQRKEH